MIPCHRVIGADGSLTGFGGGLTRKRWLLSHEGAAYKENRAPKRPQPELDFAQPQRGSNALSPRERGGTA